MIQWRKSSSLTSSSAFEILLSETRKTKSLALLIHLGNEVTALQPFPEYFIVNLWHSFRIAAVTFWIDLAYFLQPPLPRSI